MTLSDLQINSRLPLDVVHVLIAMLFVAGLIGRAAAFWRAGHAQDVQTAGALLHLSEWFERSLVIPAYFGVLITGLLAAWLAGWPLVGALESGAPKWPLVSLVLFLSPWLVIPGYLAPRRKQRSQAMARALRQGNVTPELTAALHDRGVVLLRRAELVMVALVTVLMNAKPF
jgi:uncharacterized membrane protein